MIQNTYTINSSHAYSSGNTTSLDVPEEGYITEVRTLLEANITAGTSVTAAQDALHRVVAAMQITAAGGKNYYDITDGRQGYYHHYMRIQGALQDDGVPAAGATATQRMQIIIHPGLNPYDPFDRSIVIPAAELSNLKHKITWGASSVLGTGFTINAASTDMLVSVNEIVLEKGETRDMIWPQGINVPMYESRTITISATAANLGKTDDVPVGNTLHDILILILNNASPTARDDTNINDIGIKFPKQVRTPFESQWYPMKAFNNSFSALSNAPNSVVAGVVRVPLQWVSGQAIGLDLSAAMSGDVKLGFTIGTATGTIQLLYKSIGLA